MPMWRCPHCGTPQAETARCWVCRRSSTTCSTCRHFRRSVAASLGYCGLDRRRPPLTGLELRGCWEAGPRRAADVIPVAAAILEGEEARSPALRLREFVPVELGRRETTSSRGPRPSAAGNPARTPVFDTPLGPNPEQRAGAVADHAVAERVTLFADAEL